MLTRQRKCPEVAYEFDGGEYFRPVLLPMYRCARYSCTVAGPVDFRHKLLLYTFGDVDLAIAKHRWQL